MAQDTVINKNGKFSIYVPIQKSKNNEDGTVTISGLASDGSEDWQGEKILPLGIDTTYFDQQGFLDYEHDKSTIIGVPTKTSVNDSGLFVEAKLFKNMPEVKKVLKLFDNLKNSGVKRKLGFSIEGQVNQRDAVNPSIIKSLTLTGLAITSAPANKDTSWSIISKSIYKSNLSALEAGDNIDPNTQTGGEALKPESLIHGLTDLSYGLSQFLKCDSDTQKSILNNVASILDAKKSLNPEANVLFLQAFKGLSRQDANNILNN